MRTIIKRNHFEIGFYVAQRTHRSTQNNLCKILSMAYKKAVKAKIRTALLENDLIIRHAKERSQYDSQVFGSLHSMRHELQPSVKFRPKANMGLSNPPSRCVTSLMAQSVNVDDRKRIQNRRYDVSNDGFVPVFEGVKFRADNSSCHPK